MGERNLEARCLDRVSGSLIRSFITSIPHFWASPRRPLNVHSPTSAWNGFCWNCCGVKRPGPLQHGGNQHPPSPDSRFTEHCSKRTHEVKHGREGAAFSEAS